MKGVQRRLFSNQNYIYYIQNNISLLLLQFQHIFNNNYKQVFLRHI